MARTITIYAFGSAGDTRPMVALGHAVSKRGYDVRVLASGRFERMVRDAGLTHHELDVDPMDVVNSDEGKAWLASRNPVTLLRGFREIVMPMATRVFEQAVASASGSEAILAPATAFVGATVAEHLKIPSAQLHLQPGEPTRTASNPLVGAGRSFGPVLNRLSYTAIEQVSWQMFRTTLNRLRTQRLDLPPYPMTGPFRIARREQVPVFCGFSEVVVPRPPDWPDHVRQTGFWFLDDGDGADASAAVDPQLREFVESGSAPVYVGFGSMVPKDPEATWAQVRAGVEQAGVRAVLLGAHDAPVVVSDDGTTITVPSAPHGWLFPRCSAIVHHGGAGTTATALRAGVPSVICPFFSDQPFWAARVAALGAGTASLPIKSLTAESLADRLREAVGSPAMQASARAAASKLAAEDGAGTAAELIEDWLGDPRG